MTKKVAVWLLCRRGIILFFNVCSRVSQLLDSRLLHPTSRQRKVATVGIPRACIADRTTLNEWRTHKGWTELKRKPIPTQTADGPHRMAAWRCWSRSQAWLAIFSIILKGWKLQYRSKPQTDMGRHCRHCWHLLLNFCIPQQTPSLLTNRQVEIAF